MIFSSLSITNTLLRNSIQNSSFLRSRIHERLENDGIVILPPLDVLDSIGLLQEMKITVNCTILDPWYNKGIGGAVSLDVYDAFITELLENTAQFSNHIYLWGFPEIIGHFVRYAPNGFRMTAWLTWYYKNCPSVIRGWRSSQNACIHYSHEKFSKLHPENFIKGVLAERFDSGKMRFIPGPSSVIEEPLIIGFVGKNEKTDHPAQKPEKVFERIILMATADNEIVFDPMAGSGTTAAVAKNTGRRAIVCDSSEEFIAMIEKRIGITRIKLEC